MLIDMRLSIITINLNNRDGLQKTIDSVVSQSFRDFEWIVIDGGSSDGSRELIEQYAAHFAYWESEPDKGIYNAMNKGIRKAQGEYCMFLNSGDFLYKDTVLQEVFDTNPSYDVFYGNYYTTEGQLRNGVDEEEVTMFTFMDYTIHHSGCAFIKRSLFDVYGLYDENLKIVSDWKWFLEVVGLGFVSLGKIELPISVYDVSGVSSMMIEKRQEERRLVIQEIVPPRIALDYRRYVELLNLIVQQEKQIRASWPYRIGHAILAPIKWVSKLFVKKK